MSTSVRTSTDASSFHLSLESGSLDLERELRFKVMIDDDGIKSKSADTEKNVVARLKLRKEPTDLGDALDDEAWSISPHNPLTWSSTKKWTMTSIVSLYTLVA
jgi:hypothetical protein